MANLPPIRKQYFHPDATNWGDAIAEHLTAIDDIYEGMPDGVERPLAWPLPIPMIGYDGTITRLPHRTRLHAIQPIASPIKTLATSHTNVTKTLENVPADQQLASIVVDPFLWQSLTRYTLGNEQQIYDAPMLRRRSNQYDMAPVLQDFQLQIPSAWDHGNQTYPLRSDQILGYKRTDGWHTNHMIAPSIIANSEASVQDVFRDQFMIPTNFYLKIRFGGEHSDLPGWNRFCNLDAVPAGQNFLTNVKAGHPDFLMRTSYQPGEERAFAEIKTWWSYRSQLVSKIYTNAAASGGEFLWAEKDLPNRIMKQIWSEVHRYRAPIGLWTNGRVAFIAIKTDTQQLTLSPLRDWIDPDVYFGLLGISFMVGNVGHGGLTMAGLINTISPPGIRHPPLLANLRPIPEAYLENDEAL